VEVPHSRLPRECSGILEETAGTDEGV
jgi:hypothetical protein